MEKLYGYAILIAALAVLCALFEGLIPEGRLRSTVQFAIGLLFLIGIVAPLVELFYEGEFIFEISEMETTAWIWPEQLTHEELLQKYYDQSIIE